MESDFTYLQSPFNFNAPDVAKYPPEISGNFLLRRMAKRLGWSGLDGRKIYDFGCGSRFAQTIANLGLDVEAYCGVDLNSAAIQWLKANLSAPKFRFAHIDARHALYRPESNSSMPGENELPFSGETFDAACMFSVITHQSAEEARTIFTLLRRSIHASSLYFTAFVDDAVLDYAEKDPLHPRLFSTFAEESLRKVVEESGWRIEAKYEPDAFQQTAFVCLPA